MGGTSESVPRRLVWGAWLLVAVPLLFLVYLFFVKGTPDRVVSNPRRLPNMAFTPDQVIRGKPGDKLFLASQPEGVTVAVVFEDDGETGYFYACETTSGPILDALQVYDVAAVSDRDREAEFQIGWSASGRQAILLINAHPHAVFDFEVRRGWCRSGFPPPGGEWSVEGHGWDDACLAAFR